MLRSRVSPCLLVHNKGLVKTVKFKDPKYVIYTNEEFFKVFNYQWMAGTKEKILQSPNELVLTEGRAKKYFPSIPIVDIIGKTLVYNDSIPLKVSGVVADFNGRTDIIFKEFINRFKEKHLTRLS